MNKFDWSNIHSWLIIEETHQFFLGDFQGADRRQKFLVVKASTVKLNSALISFQYNWTNVWNAQILIFRQFIFCTTSFSLININAEVRQSFKYKLELLYFRQSLKFLTKTSDNFQIIHKQIVKIRKFHKPIRFKFFVSHFITLIGTQVRIIQRRKLNV